MHLPAAARSAAALCGLALIASCSVNFDVDAGGLPLLGGSRAAETFPRVNRDSVASLALLRDDADQHWAAIYEFQKPPLDEKSAVFLSGQVHLVPLDATSDAPLEEDFIDCDGAIFGERIVYSIHFDIGDAHLPRLRLLRPGQGNRGLDVALPTQSGLLTPGPSDVVFLFEATSQASAALRHLIVRTDGSFERELPPRPQLEASGVLRGSDLTLFDPSGDWLVRQNPDGRLFAFSTRDTSAIDLGLQDRIFGADDRDPVVYTCGDSGLWRVPIDEAPPLQLDSAPCRIVYLDEFASLVDGTQRPNELIFHGVTGYFIAKKLGGERVRLAIPSEANLLAVGPQKQSAYMLNSSFYMNAAGDLVSDGWLGDWQFMQRGRAAKFSADGARLHWLENAARSDNTGELMGALTGQGASSTQLLARNVMKYSQLPGGSLLAVSNAAAGSLYSRVILIDQAAQAAYRIAENSYDYLPVPNSSDLLLKVRSSPERVDLYRVPVQSAPAN